MLSPFLLVSACTAPEESSSTSIVSTDLPTITSTTSATETPEQTAVPTKAPELTQEITLTPEPTTKESTQERLDRLPFDRPDISMALPEGDPERGGKLGLARNCINCHVQTEGVPRFGADGTLPAILDRAALRIDSPAYSGDATTPTEYLLESITDPRLYEVDGDWPHSMGDYYYDLPEQDLADLIAWMLTFE
jgi:hypothetical protein